jgi:hypothetical protein
MNTHIVSHNGRKRWRSQGSLAKEKRLSARKILPLSTKHTKKCIRIIRCNSKTKLKAINHENEWQEIIGTRFLERWQQWKPTWTCTTNHKNRPRKEEGRVPRKSRNTNLECKKCGVAWNFRVRKNNNLFMIVNFLTFFVVTISSIDGRWMFSNKEIHVS